MNLKFDSGLDYQLEEKNFCVPFLPYIRPSAPRGGCRHPNDHKEAEDSSRLSSCLIAASTKRFNERLRLTA